MREPTFHHDIFGGSTTVSAGSSVLAGPFYVSRSSERSLSLEVQLSGSGTLDFSWVGTLDPSKAGIKPDSDVGSANILGSQTASSGENSDGHNLAGFTIKLVNVMWIRATETTTTDSVTIDWDALGIL